MPSKAVPFNLEHFYQVVTREPFSAALILGKLFKNKSKTNQEHLKGVAEQLTSVDLERLINTIENMPTPQKPLLDPDSVKLLNHVCRGLLEQDAFAAKLNPQSLILLNQNELWARWPLYRAIQNHNPNQEITLDSRLLNKAGLNQTYEQVAGILKAADALPIQILVEMASSSTQAEAILKDLSQHPSRFELSQSLIVKFPSLANGIAKNWINLLNTQPRPALEEKALHRVAKKLAPQHPQFAPLENLERPLRAPVPPPATAYNSFFDNRLVNKGIIGLSALYHAPAASKLIFSVKMAARGIAINSSPPTVGTLLFSASTLTASVVGPVCAYQGIKYLWNRHQAKSRLPEAVHQIAPNLKDVVPAPTLKK